MEHAGGEAVRFRTGMLAVVLGGAVLVSAFASAPALAQGGGSEATVVPVQGLRFGPLIPGASSRIGTADVGQRGELQVEGSGQYQVQFILPEAMVSAGGATIRLDFGPSDAVVVRGTAGSPLVFDPQVGTSLSLTGNVREAQLFLGGTAFPSPNQAAGSYSANITVLVARN